MFATVNKKKLGSCLEFLVKLVLLSEWRFSHTRLVQWDLHNDAIVFVLWKIKDGMTKGHVQTFQDRPC